MGNIFGGNNQTNFDEKKYNEIFANAKPFDLVFFTSDEYTSLLIKTGQEIFLNKKKYLNTEYSHVAMIVTKDILNIPELDEKKLYIIESTIPSSKTNECPDIYHIYKNGVQIRDLYKVCQFYSTYPNAKIALSCLKNNPCNVQDKSYLCEKFTTFYDKVKDNKYADYYSLISSLIPFFRFLREPIQKLINSENRFFCSELVTLIYKEFNIYSNIVNEKNVVPMDLLGCDTDDVDNGGITCVVSTPPNRFI